MPSYSWSSGKHCSAFLNHSTGGLEAAPEDYGFVSGSILLLRKEVRGVGAGVGTVSEGERN